MFAKGMCWQFTRTDEVEWMVVTVSDFCWYNITWFWSEKTEKELYLLQKEKEGKERKKLEMRPPGIELGAADCKSDALTTAIE